MGKLRSTILISCCLALAAEAEPILFRISIENVSSHFQAKAMRSFAERLAERCGDELSVELYDGARMYRDVDVIPALARGLVEMAVPGAWQLDRAVPDVAAIMLPSAYGREIEEMRALVDGPLGASLSRAIEGQLPVVLPGRWLDLGYAHLFSAGKPIARASDLAGRRVRVAGGRANEERIRAMGGTPLAIPFTDLPAFLDGRLVDALLSTFETIDSGGLAAHGISSFYEDREYYPFYVPLVNREAWNRLSPGARQAIRECWEELLPAARAASVEAQEKARARLVAAGLKAVTPSAAERAEVRRELVEREDAIASKLGITAATLALLRRELRETVK